MELRSGTWHPAPPSLVLPNILDYYIYWCNNSTFWWGTGVTHPIQEESMWYKIIFCPTAPDWIGFEAPYRYIYILLGCASHPGTGWYKTYFKGTAKPVSDEDVTQTSKPVRLSCFTHQTHSILVSRSRSYEPDTLTGPYFSIKTWS